MGEAPCVVYSEGHKERLFLPEKVDGGRKKWEGSKRLKKKKEKKGGIGGLCTFLLPHSLNILRNRTRGIKNSSCIE